MTKKDQIDLLKSSVEEWNEYRAENLYFVPDLSNANLSNANLINTDLSHANLFKIIGKRIAFYPGDSGRIIQVNFTDGQMQIGCRKGTFSHLARAIYSKYGTDSMYWGSMRTILIEYNRLKMKGLI